MGKQICNWIFWLSLCLKSALRMKKWYFYFTHSKLDRRVTQLTLTLSSGAEIELRSDNYFWALVARQHI